MDDLISRKRIMDEAKRISGSMTGDGWDNWGVYALIERQPSVPAVQLDKLCEWLGEQGMLAPCFFDQMCDECELKPYWRPKKHECWKKAIKKWMEEQHDNG